MLIGPLDPIQGFDDLGVERWMSWMPPFSHVAKKMMDPAEMSFAGCGAESLTRDMGPPPRALIASPADAAEVHRRMVGDGILAALVPGQDKEESMKSVMAALEKDPESPLVAFYAAEIAMRWKEWKLATECVRQVLDAHPHPRHATSLASCLLEADGDPEEAMEALERAKELDPRHWKARLMRASLLAGFERKQEAMQELDSVLAEEPPEDVAEDAQALREEFEKPAT